MRLPIGFAQVREDCRLDLTVIERLIVQKARVIMVASGGCTAAALVCCKNVARLHLVDPNPSQIALARLKIHLLGNNTSRERLALLGHLSMPAEERVRCLTKKLRALGLSPDLFGGEKMIGDGLDQAGRYERTFAELRSVLSGHSRALSALLRLKDPGEQARRVKNGTKLGRALEKAFNKVMALPNLVALFGKGATANPVQPFSMHFFKRTQHVLATLPVAENPFLWQMLRGRFPPGVPCDWFSAPRQSFRSPSVSWAISNMASELEASRPGSYDLVHLSNILDWLSPEEAKATLALAWRALAVNGLVFIRQLNSRLDIPACGMRFQWLTDVAADLHRRDRSFFYRALHLGKKI